MTIVHFITYPEVIIDPTLPVTNWQLLSAGARPMQLAVQRPWVASVRTVFCSEERRAIEAADILAD